jgi:hypothetical protein
MLRSFFGPREKPVERVVQIYFSGTRFIVAAMHRNNAGIHYEQADPVVIDVRQSADVGVAFRTAFDAFSVRDRDLSAAKKSDWPAYIASGMQSMKAFEREYTSILCEGLNASNSVVRASRVYPRDPEMALSIAFNPLLDADVIGAMLLRLARDPGGNQSLTDRVA